MTETIRKLLKENPVVSRMAAAEEIIWINPDRRPFQEACSSCALTMADIDDAEERLQRFAPFIMKCFPETAPDGGIIESELVPIPEMHKWINGRPESRLDGKLLLKKDSHLAIAGSVKARGGIYEVLKHTEDLAIENGILSPGDDYARLADSRIKQFFGQYTIQVGSTGNLGLSIGIMSAAIGYHAIVHMSADAKQWKKDLLRSHGVTVIEYQSDYSEAVKNGRKQSDENPMSYFVDDENSVDLFLGYAVAAKRLAGQLAALNRTVDEEHPLFVYLPCGVGGAPGGITFGIKQVFKDAAHCFFIEPVQAPCMGLGMASGLQNAICVQDIGLSGITQADGLAVGRPSGFVGEIMKPFVSGILTVRDEKLYDYMRAILTTEKVFLEPSACAAFEGPVRLNSEKAAREYIRDNHLEDNMKNATHIIWATGGRLVPEEIRKKELQLF